MNNSFFRMPSASRPGVVCLGLLCFTVLCPAERNSNTWTVREEETIRKTLSLSGAPMRLLVENVDGYVHVTAISGSQVRVTAHKTIRAESASDLRQAKSEVTLDMSEQPGTVAISYDAPWICRGYTDGCHNQQRRFYKVTYDIDIEVPRQARPFVSTVNNGDVRVDGTGGDFEIKNVNGGIALTDISGSGEVHTVNGPITAHFAKSPSSACSFKSINGQMDVYFPSDLSADFRFKTFNGQIYSDFEVDPVAVPDGQGERKEGKYIYRSNGLHGARVGRGGPQLTFDAFNGNIRIHKAGQAAASNQALHMNGNSNE